MRFLLKSIASFILFASLLQFPLFAQEKMSPGDLLRWLPDQPYRLIKYYDYSALRKVADKEGMKLGFLTSDNGDWFIEQMQAKLVAIPLQVSWRGDKTAPTFGDMREAEEVVRDESSVVLKGYEIAHREIRILVFDDVDEVTKEAVELGVLAPLEEKFNGHIFYRMRRPVTHEKTGRWIAATAGDRYLILATSVSQMQSLIDTNGQTDRSVYGSLYMIDLVDRLADLGQYWEYEATGVTKEEVVAAMAAANGWPPDSLKRVKDKQRYRSRCRIDSDVYGDEWYSYSYFIFDPEIALHDSEEATKLAPAELGAPVEPGSKPVPEGLEHSVRIEGNVIVLSTRRDVYARNKWKETQERIRAWREMRNQAK